MSTHSVPFLLSQAAVTAIAGDFTAEPVSIRDNPSTRAAFAEGARVVFLVDSRDKPSKQPNQSEARAFTFEVGVINRTAADRAGADDDMQRIKLLLARAMPAACRGLKESGDIIGHSALRELERYYRVEDVDVGGALIVTAFEIEYTTPNTSIRGRP